MATISNLKRVTSLTNDSLFLVNQGGVTRVVPWSFILTNIVGFQGSRGSSGFMGSRGSMGFTGSSSGFTGSGGFGFTGSRGSGFIGSQGFTGFSGSQGPQGIEGPPGPPNGFTGSRGILGVTGSMGYSGSRGFTGSAGPQGTNGFLGSVGFTGSGGPGYTGSSGNGFTGSSGEAGFRGSQGELGFTGSSIGGYVGSTGPQGPAGGYTGSSGEIGFIGSKGEPGSPGGYTGSAGLGFRGSQGYEGSKGFTGSFGFTGSSGNGAQGFSGSSGLIGSFGFTGSSGNFGSITSHMLPATDLTYDLGSPTKRWRDLYISTNTIYLGDNAVSISAAGQMLINGNSADTKLDYFGGEGVGPKDAAWIQWNTSTITLNIPGKELLSAFYDLQPGTKIEAGGFPNDPNTRVLTINGTVKEYLRAGQFPMAEIAVSESTGTAYYFYSLYLPVKEKTAVVANGTYTLAVNSTGGVVFPDGSVQYSASSGGTATTGTSLGSRVALSASSTSLSPNSAQNLTIQNGFKSYSLLKVQTNVAAWVRVYSSDAARTADQSRSQGTDPVPGNGVIAEVVTAGEGSQAITPATIGFNDEQPVSNRIYMRVTNLHGSSSIVTATITVIQLEA